LIAIRKLFQTTTNLSVNNYILLHLTSSQGGGRWGMSGCTTLDIVDPEKLNFNDSTRIVHKNFILIRYTVNNLKLKRSLNNEKSY